ncbi:STREFT protein [Mycoplasma capricolum]|uniref:STREFT protein n=1 Tax=Mycoplasma capricolum TaxID=2095 RepID=UPI003DA69317
MLKFIKNNKWWVAIISIFAIFFSSFGIFAKSYVDSNKQKIVNKIQNYVQASSYAVRSRILKETENLNEDYLNQKIGKKPLLSEFNGDFIWRPNNSKTTSSDTISDLWKTYFGSSSNVLNKDLQIQYKNNNEYKNIESSKGEITPKNIDFLLSISKSAEKFLNGFAPSLASLGLSFLQNKVLNDRDDPNFKKYKDGINKFADVIENNKDLFSYLGKLLTPKPLEKDYYKDLTVQQALIKNINQIASAIADNKEFAKETEVDKLPEALDKILVELGLNSLDEIIAELINSKNGFENLGKIFSKIKNIFTSQNLQKLKIKGLELLDKITPHLATYLYSEIFFGLYYVAHEEIKNPNDLLVQKTDDSKFLILVNNKLDFNVLLNGLSKILKDKKNFKRFYEFIFKRFDKNKIYNSVNDISSNNGVGNLVFDLINWLEKKLYNVSNTLKILIRFSDIALKEPNIKKTIEEKIATLISTKLKELGNYFGEWKVSFVNGVLLISAGSTGLFSSSYFDAKIHLFDKEGIFKKLLNIINNLHSTIESFSSNISKYLKDILFLENKIFLDLSNISKKFLNIINEFKNLLGDKSTIYVYIKFLWIFNVSINDIYDIFELPYKGSSLTRLVGLFAKDKIDPYLEKLKSVSQNLKKYKFINDETKIRYEFPKYLDKFSEYLKIYEKSENFKFNLIDSLYSGNLLLDFVSKWIDFILKNAEDKDNAVLPLVRIITKNENLESLKFIKDKWTSKVNKLANKVESFSNISKIANTKIHLPEELLKQLDLENINNQTIAQLLETLSNYFKDYLAKYPNKVIGFKLSNIGMILTALTIKVGVQYNSDNITKSFLYNKNPKLDKSKTILKALTYGFDTHDNSNDTNDIKNIRPKESYYNWDKIHFYINGSNEPYTIDRSTLKDDSSYSPLHMLLGINIDKTSYFKGSIGYVFGTLFGGLSASDENYSLSIENKQDATSIFNVFVYVLEQKEQELKKEENKIATKYYVKSAWSTKILSSNENEITYELIRLKSSDTKESKRLGTRFKVRLLKNKNNPYWSINRVIALDYKVA